MMQTNALKETIPPRQPSAAAAAAAAGGAGALLLNNPFPTQFHNHEYKTIHDIPTNLLTNEQELILTIVMNRNEKQILLYVPNTLGWKCHFGCIWNQQDEPDPRKVVHKELIKTGVIKMSPLSTRKKNDNNIINLDSIFHVGTMLFSFQNSKIHNPMRVTVMQAEINNNDLNSSKNDNNDNSSEENDPTLQENIPVGRWLNWKDCPYHEMWADDSIWLPKLLNDDVNDNNINNSRIGFQGHFVFDDTGPGATAKLLQHNCQFYTLEDNK